jgi:hypothetical protein
MTEVYGKTIIDAPYSVALDAMVRRLRAKKYLINLIVPLRKLGIGTDLGLEREVRVSFATHHGHKGERLMYDEMQLVWEPSGGGPFPLFSGSLKLHPEGLKTEIILSGEYKPPLGLVGEAFDAVIGKRIAEVTAETLLETIKTELEADFATVRATIEDSPQHHV